MKSNVELGRRASGRRPLVLTAPLALLFALALPGAAAARQWTTNGNNINNTNTGNVGVGTSTPDKFFTVQGQIASPLETMSVIRTTGSNNGFGLALDATGAGNNNLGFLRNGAAKAGMAWDNPRSFLGLVNWAYANSDFALRLNSDGSLSYHDSLTYPAPERFRVTASGNVGIGTAAPGRRLEVLAPDGEAARLYRNVANAGWGVNMVFAFDNSAGARTDYAGVHGILASAAAGAEGGGLVFSTKTGGALTEKLRIDSAGNVGIGTGAPATKLHVDGDVTVTGNISAKYQDVAEWVPSVQKLAPGTVVVLDRARPNHVLASTAAYDTGVAGVVSGRPGVILGEGGADKVMVATTGRVKVKVDATRAPVRIGDLIVTSDVEGMAMRSEPVALGGRQFHAPGTIIGKALEPLEKGAGEILVLLSLQ
jgi:hypothetical protein